VARRGTLRASDADRDEIVDRLRKASAEGRLAAHELEHRVTTALKAQTYAELDATVADLTGNRVAHGRSAPQVALQTVRAHPALLLIAIPVAVVTVATLIAVTVLWSTLVLLLFVLGHRRFPYRGPWMYAGRRFGPPGTADGRTRGYWA
jgi:hypothetical protein